VASRRSTRSIKAFETFLSLYPAAFRDDYGRELTLVFIDRYRDAAGRGDRARLWAEAIAGIAAEAPKEHARMILQDVRYALRMLRKHALVTATIVLTLALGIGVNTAIFSLLNAVVIKSLPLPEADRLFVVRGSPLRFSGPLFDRLRQSVPDGVGVAAMSRVARVYTRRGDAGEAERTALQLVSSNYFELLGSRPVLGRSFAADRDDSPSVPWAIVSHAYWQRRLGGTGDALGTPLTINGSTFTIVGVAAPGFSGVWLEAPVDIWVPLGMQHAVRYSQNYSAYDAETGKPWRSQETISWLEFVVRADRSRHEPVLAALAASLNRPDRPALTLEPFGRGFSNLRQQFTTPLLALGVMAALVLLTACLNIANLLLARARAVQREMALRMSLGARRSRLLHQLLVESAILVTASTAAALMLGRWAGDFLVRTATASVTGPAPFTPQLDVRVLAFTAVVAAASVILFGVLPAWRATRVDIVGALNAAARGNSAASSARPARLLVVAQVAVSLVLAAATGLIARSFTAVLNVNLGFDRQHLLSVAIDPRLTSTSREATIEMLRRAVDDVRALPGVTSTALAMCGLQASCRSVEGGKAIEGYQPAPKEEIAFLVNAVSPDYFATVGMRVLAGRPIDERDTAATRKVAVVNRTVAERYFRGQAVGKRFGDPTPDTEIVGVVDDARTLNIKEPPMPAAFYATLQIPAATPRQMEVRTQGDPAHMAAAVRAAIARVAPALPIEGITTVDDRVNMSLSRERLILILASGFGILALGLAGFGLFGMLSYAVSRRVPEFGIRMALGAPRSRVIWSVMRDALLLVASGLVVGVPFALMSSEFVTSLIGGQGVRNGIVLLSAAGSLFAVGVAASAWPALRASRVDPIVALRQD
jgi:macrolide transport system ATP-binding/permease protein